MATTPKKKASKKRAPRAATIPRRMSGKTLATKAFLAHYDQLKRHVDRNGVRGLEKLYRESRGELLARIRKAGKRKDSVDHETLRALLKQVDEVMGAMEAGLEEHLADAGKKAVELGVKHGADEYRALAKHFTGTTPIVNVDVPATFRGLVKDVDSSLLRRYRLQSRNWSTSAISQMERKLSISAATGKSLEDVVDDLLGVDGFEGERYRAERIVRTEMAYAHGNAKLRSLEGIGEELDQPMFKRIIETFDDRTGDDSFVLHGQTVPIGEPFTWKTKRRGSWVVLEYMHPPNRPNDRAVVIPWDPSWEETAQDAPLTLGELRGAPPTRWRKKVGVEIPPGHKPGKSYR